MQREIGNIEASKKPASFTIKTFRIRRVSELIVRTQFSVLFGCGNGGQMMFPTVSISG